MAEPPLEPWHRLGIHIHVMLKVHPSLQPLLQRGASVWVDAEPEGVSALLVHSKRIREARLTEPAWYEPNLPEHGEAVAHRLAAALTQGP